MSLSEGLKRARKHSGKTQRDMAAFLNLQRAYQSYEQGEHEPPISKLIKLADYFDVSLDYLVSRSDNPKRL